MSVTVAPGGLGKSTIITAEAVAMATGKPIMGVQSKQHRVWLWNLEDPMDEINRKIYALAQHHGLSGDDFGNRLLVNSGRDEPLVIATAIGGSNILTPAADLITQHINEYDIDCVIVDPFVSSHQLSENDNVAIDMVVKRWAQIASDSNCAIHLVHHVRKDNGIGGASVADARGASALVDAARFVRRLQRMTGEEARNAGIDEDQHWRYTREGDSKNNLSPPNADSTWRKRSALSLNGITSALWSLDVARRFRRYAQRPEAVQRAVAAGEYRESHRARTGSVTPWQTFLTSTSATRTCERRFGTCSTWIENDALQY